MSTGSGELGSNLPLPPKSQRPGRYGIDVRSLLSGEIIIRGIQREAGSRKGKRGPVGCIRLDMDKVVKGVAH